VFDDEVVFVAGALRQHDVRDHRLVVDAAVGVGPLESDSKMPNSSASILRQISVRRKLFLCGLRGAERQGTPGARLVP